MANPDYPDSGAIFKNDRKSKDSDPFMRGDALIDGVEYWVSAWKNVAKTGATYISLKYTKKEQQHQQGMTQARQAAAPAPETEGFDDEIPF